MKPRQALRVNGTECRRIRLSVSPDADFRSVLHALDSIEVPLPPLSYENVRFAILELVRNSISAHRDANEQRDILVELSCIRGTFGVTVRDFGGGFDPRKLPYRLEASPSSLDLTSRNFVEYRNRNGQRKFGIGISIAKKTFDRFRLEFLDKRDMPVPWIEGRIMGTRVTAEIFLEGASDDI